MEEESEHGRHGVQPSGFFSHLTPKQKLIGGGVAAAVVLGLLASRNKGSGQTSTGGSGAVDPVQVPIPVPVYGGGGSGGAGGVGGVPPIVTTPTPIPIPQPVPQPVGLPLSGGVPRGPILSAPLPVAAPPIVTAAPDSQSIAAYQAQGVSPRDAQILAARDSAIAQLDRGGLSDSQAAQLRQQVAQEDSMVTVANAANSLASPIGGFGGGNYYTDGYLVAQGIAANEQKLSSDPAFVNAEIQRANQVIKNREDAGVSTADQQNYLAHLHDVQNQQSQASTSLGTQPRVVSPNPTPTPASDANPSDSRDVLSTPVSIGAAQGERYTAVPISDSSPSSGSSSSGGGVAFHDENGSAYDSAGNYLPNG